MVNDYYELSMAFVDEDTLLRGPDDSYEIKPAFAMALFENHPLAYDLIDPALIPRLDKWMKSHQTPECISSPRAFRGHGIWGNVIALQCETTGNEEYRLAVEIEEGENLDVTDWSILEDGY